MRTIHVRHFEHGAIRLSLVHSRKGKYVSDETLQRRQKQNRRNRTILGNCTATNELGQEYNRYRKPKGNEIIGITWEKVVFPNRIHQWTIQHKCDTNKMKRPVELKEPANESAAIITLHQTGSGSLESCQ